MNKRGDFIGLIVFIIIAFIVVAFSGIMIYIQGETEAKLHEVLDDGNLQNASHRINQTFVGVGDAYDNLPWLSTLLIIGMIMSILIGSYLVTTKPVMFVPFVFFMFFLVIMGAVVSNAYEEFISDATLSDSFARFTASNWFLLHLPEVLAVVGFLGAIVMFSRMGRRDDSFVT